MWNRRKITSGIILLLLLFFSRDAQATHIVGGEITYTCKGKDAFGRTVYRIKISIYQDCKNGLINAIREDYPAYLGIFSNDGLYAKQDSIGNFSGGQVDSLLVPPNFNNSCVNNPPEVCLKRMTFQKDYALPSNSSGFKVIYIRCCRNEAIQNLNHPERVGATYFCEIPPTQEVVGCNNSAVFKNYPPQIICINNPLLYDNSATDVDGDSLSYELCDAYPGGRTDDPKPMPRDRFLPPPLTMNNANPPSYGYRSGFSPQRPMGGNPLIQLDPVTGILSGTPNLQGRYVVSVCVHEWRNGVVINTVRREFQFTVTNCSKAVVAEIPQLSEEYNTYIVSCKSKTIKFLNKSTGGFKYNWNFGVPGATSTQFEPEYTYPDTGTYTVSLVVNEGSTCPDSISRYVKVYPDYNAEYRFDGLQCPNSQIQFLDMSQATYKPIVKWKWDFGDGGTSEAQNPVHSYTKGGDYKVRLISSSIKGCVDTVSRVLPIERFHPFAGNDTIIVKGEYINFNAQGGIEYLWSPSDRLNSVSISNPRGYYPDTGRYDYSVFVKSAFGCTGYDSINVWVVNQPSLFVPSAFSPNGDGLNDFLKPLSVGYKTYKYFRVVNRWGQVVFQTDQIGQGWDGTFSGKQADVGTYFWILDAEDRNGAYDQIKGDVTLIR